MDARLVWTVPARHIRKRFLRAVPTIAILTVAMAFILDWTEIFIMTGINVAIAAFCVG
ncbi:MAG TPA: hypothetical protein VNZ52_17195 [Candidatus Thermoplasmatota archaeon]|nr:hypothetical protein [Candidatus Thermoplasmatota archaeon]